MAAGFKSWRLDDHGRNSCGATPQHLGGIGFLGLVGLLAALIFLPAWVALDNLTKDATKQLIIQLEKEVNGQDITIQELKTTASIRTFIGQLLATEVNNSSDNLQLAMSSSKKRNIESSLAERLNAGHGVLWLGTLAFMT